MKTKTLRADKRKGPYEMWFLLKEAAALSDELFWYEDPERDKANAAGIKQRCERVLEMLKELESK